MIWLKSQVRVPFVNFKNPLINSPHHWTIGKNENRNEKRKACGMDMAFGSSLSGPEALPSTNSCLQLLNCAEVSLVKGQSS